MSQQLLHSIELTTPVVLAQAGEPCPPGLMASSNQAGTVVVRLGGVLHFMDTLTALRLLRDLRCAVETSAGWPPT